MADTSYRECMIFQPFWVIFWRPHILSIHLQWLYVLFWTNFNHLLSLKTTRIITEYWYFDQANDWRSSIKSNCICVITYVLIFNISASFENTPDEISIGILGSELTKELADNKFDKKALGGIIDKVSHQDLTQT